MIIKLKGANFSTNNINALLNSYFVSITYKYVDAEENVTMTKQYGVKQAPTLVVNGKNQELIENWIKEKQQETGESRFYISLEDDLMRLFGSDRMTGIVNALGLPEDQPIEHKMLSGAIENAQKRVEGRNFQIRKHVLQYDDVMNQQREIIYGQRQQVLNGDSMKDSILKMLSDFIDEIVDRYTGSTENVDDWNLAGLLDYLATIYLPAGMVTFTREDMEYLTKEELKIFITLLNPFAPHLTEEMWVLLGFEGMLNQTAWPKYDEAKTEQAKVETRIAELEEMLKDIIVVSEVTTDSVGVGSKVRVYNEKWDEEIEYAIVGSTEADPLNNKISDESPVGRALLGHSIGEEVIAEAPGGHITFKISSYK